MGGKGSKSKKRSAASFPSRPPERFVIFIDRSLGNKIIASALRGAGAQIEVHDDHFAPDVRDEIWLTEAGRRRWLVLTKDQKIRYRPIELQAVRQARVKLFTLVSRNLTGPEMASIIVRALPRILRFAQTHEPPFIAKIGRDGKVTMLIDQ